MPAAMKSPTHAAVPADPAGTGEAPGPAVQPGKVLGIFDLGSNSVRLMGGAGQCLLHGAQSG